ncbi:hypothetical protein FHT80_006375 [Rhizobium sp. BK226]|nr:hypothetical protein [Rhizobium sp. BK226]
MNVYFAEKADSSVHGFDPVPAFSLDAAFNADNTADVEFPCLITALRAVAARLETCSYFVV